jgi:hypothetical protein
VIGELGLAALGLWLLAKFVGNWWGHNQFK